MMEPLCGMRITEFLIEDDHRGTTDIYLWGEYGPPWHISIIDGRLDLSGGTRARPSDLNPAVTAR